MTSHAPTASAPALPSGWGLTLRVFGVLLAGSALLLALAGTGEDGVRMWIRATARASALLFLLAFTARPLVQLASNRTTRWLLRNRRYVGVSGGLAHLLHGIAIGWLLTAWPEAYRANPITLIGGGLGFVFYFAMALTSSDAAVAALGRRRWKLLHTVGGYYVWFIFAFTFWGNVQYALAGKLDPAHQVLYVGIEVLMLAALGLRAAARVRGRGYSTA